MVARHGETVLLVYGATLWGLDATTGETRWQHTVDDLIKGVTLDEERLYLASETAVSALWLPSSE